jgi:hypothetical protein
VVRRHPVQETGSVLQSITQETTENPVFARAPRGNVLEPDVHTQSLTDTLFDLIDVDGSGEISMEEFVDWWEVHASDSAEDEVQLEAAIDIFEELDEDNTGQLDRIVFTGMIGMLQLREWVAATDPRSGRKFFRNKLTREAKWGDQQPNDDEAVDKWLERTFSVLSRPRPGATENPLSLSRAVETVQV